MVTTVRIAAAQMTYVNDLSANFATCSRLVKEAVNAGAKLLCFPENFSYFGAKTGDSLSIAEPLDGRIRFFSPAEHARIGRRRRTIVTTNRKMHLLDVDVPCGAVYKESSFTEAGDTIGAVDTPLGSLGLTVCYDLRFPELYQQLRSGAQVLLVPSASTRVTGEAQWEILLRARAIETQCYVIAASQAGKHSEGRESYGDTLIIDPWGKVIGRLTDRLTTGIAVADIDFALIDLVRSKMLIDQHRKP